MVEIGSSLREARRRRNLELTQVEQATRIRVQQLEALEQERFERLPPDPYRRSFLREYADYLGLDGDIYTSEYDRRFHPQPPELAAPPKLPRSGRPRFPPRLEVLLAGSGIVLLVIGVAVWLLTRPGSKPVARAQTTATHTRTHAQATPPPKLVPTHAPMLVIKAARGSCWLLVRVGSPTGPAIYQQTLQAGRTVRFGLRRHLWIRLGAPWNVDAAIAGSALTLPARTGDVVASAAGLVPTG